MTGTPLHVEMEICLGSKPAERTPTALPYAIGRALSVPEHAQADEEETQGRYLLPAPSPVETGQRIAVRADRVIPIPDDVTDRRALLAPPLAAALGAWSTLELELGAAAVFAGDGEMDGVLGLTALWHGAMPVVYLSKGSELNMPEEITPVYQDEPESAFDTLITVLGDNPACAGLDASGDPEIVDLLLNCLPKWGHLMLGSNPTEPLTLDYYSNIHRKGVRIRTGFLNPRDWPDTENVAIPHPDYDGAFAVLASDSMTAQYESVLPRHWVSGLD